MKTDHFYLGKIIFLITFIACIMNFNRCKRHSENLAVNQKGYLSRAYKNHIILELNLFYF